MILAIPFLASENFSTVSAFDPTSIAGLKLWFQPSSLSALNNNDPVATWPDSSGNSNDALQSTAGNKPLYKTNIINGLASVLFDGTDDWMSFTSNSPVTAASAFVVTQPTLNTASQKTYAAIVHGATGSNNSFRFFAKLTSSFWGGFIGGADRSSGNALVSGTNYLLEEVSASGSSQMYQRGTQVVNVASNDLGSSNPGALGKDLGAASREYAGYISEVLIYDTALSSTNRQNVENYLIAKYGL